ncbi:hypothetical protein PAALTS15_20893 [Paenibacillus alvei TS-15]|uniref:Uncharacterized protein n=1 Tax=Paenibacillus alvei TS-15 TaxID=1117108 RepID=S9U3X6_PAEAL|nr:hypothetical protein PAALTS15_20893 [Paenibacillus alvei TS-15]
MCFDIALSITKCILSDIQGRYQMDTFVFAATERKDLDVQVEMFERWDEGREAAREVDRYLMGTTLLP